MTVSTARTVLAEAGFDLTGTLSVGEYDALVSEAWRAEHAHPGCRGVLVVGNAGRGLWPRFESSPEAKLRKNPLDRYTARVFAEAARSTSPACGFALYYERREEHYLPMIALGCRAGFGSTSRIGLLLHPVYGPWVAIRGVLYLNEPVPFEEPRAFDPCTGCPAPCASACHGGVISPGGIDINGCFRTKILNRACRDACDARSACVIGPEHAYTREQISHHSRIRWRPAVLRRAAITLLRG